MYNETIGAISTGMTNSGIGIVRIIGPDAFSIIEKIYKGKRKISSVDSHTINYGYIVKECKEIDEVLVSVMKGPNTYTGEDTVEINCHGGAYVVNKVLELVISNGARLAHPGEITKRAFLNGKKDLSQAEAVIDIINAKNDYALANSINQLKGCLKDKISSIRNKIIYQTAYIETVLDDPENYDTTGYGQELQKIVESLINEIQSLSNTFEEGRILAEGISTTIVGKPNVGKSSLLNVLAGKERAIVTEIEGTTRDALEEHINLGGLTLKIVDTAGIRDTDEIIEKIGIDKTKEYIQNADLVLYVVDGSKALDDNDYKIMELIRDRKVIVLLNKSDLKLVVNKKDLEKEIDENIIEISAKEEEGIQEFIDIVKEMFVEGMISYNDEVYISNMRQKEALVNAMDSLLKVEESIKANTNWVANEPNDELLWIKVERTIHNFLNNVRLSGALAGNAPLDAFYIVVGKSTMSQDDIDNGRLVCEIGVAPVKPAEYVIFRITQNTAKK